MVKTLLAGIIVKTFSVEIKVDTFLYRTKK